MEFHEQLFGAYRNYLKKEGHTVASLSYTDYLEKQLQQLITNGRLSTNDMERLGFDMPLILKYSNVVSRRPTLDTSSIVTRC